MSFTYLICGFFIGFALVSMFRFLFSTEWIPRKCEKGIPCGCKTITYGCSQYKICENKSK